MKDLDDKSSLLSTEIYRDRSFDDLGLSQRNTLIVSLRVLIWTIVHLRMLQLLKVTNSLKPGTLKMSWERGDETIFLCCSQKPKVCPSPGIVSATVFLRGFQSCPGEASESYEISPMH